MSDRRWALALTAAALLLRLVANLGSAIFGTDGCHYLLMADWMREGRMQDALQVAYHPMYPLLIAVGRSFGGSTEQVASIVSIVLGSAALIPLFLSARRVFGQPAAVLTALLYALSPAVAEVQSEVMTEGTYFFFFFGAIWLTGRMMEAPTAARGAVLGAAAGAAFLTRPEGLLPMALAIFWQAVVLLRARKELGVRLPALLATAVVLVLVISPYLLWVRSERGHWAISPRPSAASIEKNVGGEGDGDEETKPDRMGLVRSYLNGIFRGTLWGVLIPFYLVGFLNLKEVGLGRVAWYLSFPLGQLAGLALALRTTTFMTERYLLAGMALLAAPAAWGAVVVLRASARRWPESRIRPAMCSVLIFLVAIVPMLRCFKLRRQECRSYPLAAKAILSTGARPKAMSGLEQVAYYCGSRSYYMPRDPQALVKMQRRQPMEYYVYSDKDVLGRPGFVAMLRAQNWLEAPVEVQGPPGTWKVYIQRVRQVP